MKRFFALLLFVSVSSSGCAFIPMAAGAPFWLSAAVSGAEKVVCGAAYLKNRHDAKIGTERPLPALFLHGRGMDKEARQKAWDTAQDNAKKVQAEKEKAATPEKEQPQSVTVGLLYLKYFGSG